MSTDRARQSQSAWLRDLELARRSGNLTRALRLRCEDAQAHGIDVSLALTEECDWWLRKRLAVAEGEIQRLKNESRIGWLERALEREQQLRREAEHHLSSLKAYCDKQPYPDEVERLRSAMEAAIDSNDMGQATAILAAALSLDASSDPETAA